jgi:hypothetical protein
MKDKTIEIKDDTCWRCGNKFNKTNRRKTNHHSIPKTFKPKRNVLIPICEECHKELNAQDISALISYACKLNYNATDLIRHIKIMNNLLTDNWIKKTESEK